MTAILSESISGDNDTRKYQHPLKMERKIPLDFPVRLFLDDHDLIGLH